MSEGVRVLQNLPNNIILSFWTIQFVEQLDDIIALHPSVTAPDTSVTSLSLSATAD